MVPFAFIAALLHPVHATYAEIQWNDETERVEVALRLDLLSAQTIDRMASTGETKGRRRIAYLAKRFAFDLEKDPLDSNGNADESVRAKRYHWVGREEKGGHVWWYFEIATVDGRAPRVLRNTLLYDHDPRYRHLVSVLDAEKRTTLTFAADSPVQRLPDTADRGEAAKRP